MSQKLLLGFITVLSLTGIYLFQNEANLMKAQTGPSQELINELYERLKKTQQTGDGLIWDYTKGLYASNIKLNVVGLTDIQVQFGNQGFMPDNNMFVTNFVVLSLIQMQQLGTLQIQESDLQDAITALLSFQNKNIEEDNVPMYAFWPQFEHDGYYVCFPQNILKARNYLAEAPAVVRYMAKKFLGITVEFFDSFAKAFVIPSDNDDTGINLALGAQLKLNKDIFPNINTQWEQKNQRYDILFDQIKKYAYKPYSKNDTENSIDPRTYYYMQGYFNQTYFDATNPKNDTLLFTTWITNIQDQVVDYIAMPFWVNNVDAVVNTNSLFGLVSLLYTYDGDEYMIEQFYDDDIKRLITDVTEFIVWAIESEIILERPDLALTYYPSIYDFYYFVARTYHFLENNDPLYIFPEILKAKKQLKQVCEGAVTKQILCQSSKNSNSEIYWESFLGNFKGGIPNSDRAFSTAMALNALLDIWTLEGFKNLQYKSDTPSDVIEIINSSADFLSQLMADKSTPLENTFFSGSVKTSEDLPYYYPANGSGYYNQTTGVNTPIFPGQLKNTTDSFNPQFAYKKVLEDDKKLYIDKVEGIVGREQYWYWVYNYTWFQEDTPVDFAGFNQKGAFPYWTSDAITLSHAMLAFSKYLSVNQ